MHTRTFSVPIPTSIFISVFTFVENYFSVFYLMWYSFFFRVLKCRFSFVQIFNPRQHFRIVLSKRMENIALRYLSHFIQLFQSCKKFAKRFWLVFFRENIERT